MTGRNKKNPICEQWESNRTRERYVRVYPSMLHSDAFRDLTFRQQMLLMNFKERHIMKAANGAIYESNNGKIQFTRASQKEFYGYDAGKEFRQDVKVLIDHGFLEVTFRGANLRKPNLYGFCEDWKKWKKTGRW